MKAIITYSIIFVLIVLAFLGYKKAKKMLELKRATVTVHQFEILDKFNIETLNTGVKTKIVLAIQNYSANKYTLAQLKVDLFASSGKSLAKQQHPIQPKTLQPNSKTFIVLRHFIKSKDFINLLEENNYIDQNLSQIELLLKVLSMDMSGIKLKANGFAVVENFEVEINENITL